MEAAGAAVGETARLCARALEDVWMRHPTLLFNTTQWRHHQLIISISSFALGMSDAKKPRRRGLLHRRSPCMCHYLCMPRQRVGCQKRRVLGGHVLMLEGGTHGTLLCSDGKFGAISGCRTPFCAPHQKRGSMGLILPLGWGLHGLFFGVYIHIPRRSAIQQLSYIYVA